MIHVFCLCGVRQAPLALLPLGSSLALSLNLVLGLVLDVALHLALVQVLGSLVPTGKTIQLRSQALNTLTSQPSPSLSLGRGRAVIESWGGETGCG